MIWGQGKTILHRYRKLPSTLKSRDVYADLVEDAVTGFDISNSEFERPLPIGKDLKVHG